MKHMKQIEDFHTFFSKRSVASAVVRLDHLASLGLDFSGKTVLEVGAGAGLLTAFWEQRGCDVTSADGRPENVEMMKALWPRRNISICDLDAEALPYASDSFDIIFCYGTVYHLKKPSRAIEMLSHICRDIMLIESKTSGGANAKLNKRTEMLRADQALHGIGSRHTIAWFLDEMAKHFEHIYMPDGKGMLPGDRRLFVGARNEVGRLLEWEI